MQRRSFLKSISASLAASSPLLSAAVERPNILLIYADDVGFGDLSCYGAKAVKTPNLDRLARQGLRFTDAHSTSATCTPSRYSLMTGQYAWRKSGTGVLPGDARLILDPAKQSLPGMLRKAGYRTGVIGKWHLGLGDGNLNWNGEIKPGPLEVGFDSAFLLPATGDRVPCVYVEDHRVVNLDPTDPIQVDYAKPIAGQPTGQKNPELLKMKPSHGHDMAIVNGVSRIGHMAGGKQALWVDEDMADTFVKKAEQFLAKESSQPFFLFFATHDIHVPRLPHPRFAGKTTMGPRGDAIAELDWTVGELLRMLDKRGLTRNTMVIFSSDNGPVVDDGYVDQAVEKLGSHQPAGAWRGGKYSNFEAGTRVPFLVRWPARIRPGVSEALLGQQDLFASFAALTGQGLADEEAPDSHNLLPALLGESRQGRPWLIEHARTISIRAGDYKLIPANPGPGRNVATNTELGSGAKAQLYNLRRDPGEKQDLAEAEPAKVAELAGLLEKLRNSSRTRP